MSNGTGAPTSKIRIKIGQIEVDYEGAHSFLDKDLPKLLATIVELRQKVGESGDTDARGDTETKKKPAKTVAAGTVAAVAAKLKSSKGTDLIIAAAAKLTLVDGHDSFSRKDLLKAMRTASAYYKTSYGANLSGYLKTLQDAGRLTEQSTDKFALQAAERTKLEGQLA